jgi:vacuolar-type H+-ATPase subunit F/Vma7
LSFKIVTIADAETAAGFALAGVREVYIHEKKEATLVKLDELLASEGIGIIFITYSIAEELGFDFKRRMRAKKALPIVLRIPDKTGWVPKVDELQEIIRRTVGAEIIVKGGS